MTTFSNNGYQWFQVAELGYNSLWSAIRAADRDFYQAALEPWFRGRFILAIRASNVR